MRKYALPVVLLLAAIGVWLWWHRPPNPAPVPPSTEATNAPLPQSTNESKTASPTNPVVEEKHYTEIKKQLPDGPYEPSDPRWAEVREKDRTDKGWEWKTPINFYGKVVDENEQPIVGAKAEFGWTDLSPTGSSEAQAISDENGLFTLLNKRGRVLEVRLSKEGYYTPKTNPIGFDFAGFWEKIYYEPDSTHPVIFHLRKAGQKEPLLVGYIEGMVPANGTPTKFDFLNRGAVSPNGQLQVEAWTNTDKYPPQKFGWRAVLSVPDGGLIEANDEFPFTAPAEGYTPSIAFDMPLDEPNWVHGIEKSYFISFGSPARYGRVKISLSGASEHVFITYWINPTGSQNLESDPSQPVLNH